MTAGERSAPRGGDTGAVMDRMQAAFDVAAERDRVRTEWLRLGESNVRLRVAGAELGDVISRPLAHLGIDEPEGAPDLAIDLWDGEACGVERPIRWFRDVFHRTVRFGRAVLAFSEDESMLGYQSAEAATIYDRSSGRMLGWVADPSRLSLFERGKPLQPLLFAWQADRDVVPVHAGLVARSGRGVLLGGAGGSGKTTTSLLCLDAGLSYLGDDYIGLRASDDGRFVGYSFYSSTWLEPAHLRRFPVLVPHARHGRPDEDKALVVLDEAYPAGFDRCASVEALVLPRVAGGTDTTFHPVPKAEALLRLAPSSILQLPFIDGREAMKRMTEMIDGMPCYELRLGTEFEQIPRRVTEIIEQAGQA